MKTRSNEESGKGKLEHVALKGISDSEFARETQPLGAEVHGKERNLAFLLKDAGQEARAAAGFERAMDGAACEIGIE